MIESERIIVVVYRDTRYQQTSTIVGLLDEDIKFIDCFIEINVTCHMFDSKKNTFILSLNVK